MPSSPPIGMSNLRDLFPRSDKEKVPPDLKRALSLLQLSGLDGLEERFLATEAFLRPWAVFRDSIFLLQADAMPRATSVDGITVDNNGISRLDLLWFYTQFDEGTLRYDPRADKCSIQYTTDSSVYGVIDKSGWSVQQYEKHLYAWLLQEFKVGKSRNPWGFDYFELRNICSAWQSVFVPIINAVRASYNVKGRRYYGRLALFIEDRCPSRLAFPEGNVDVPEGSMMSPTPFRVVSVPKKMIGSNGATFHKKADSIGLLTKKHYDEAEKELRDVYPQYGGLVERPKFKHKMEEWLEEQRARANWKKAGERLGEVKTFQPQLHPSKSMSKPRDPQILSRRQASADEGTSPIKRYSDSIRRSLSMRSKKTSKEEPKSPLHGVTRQIHIPDDPPPRPTPKPEHPRQNVGQESFTSLDSTDTVITPWPRSETQRKPSEQSVYTSIRNSNPFSEDLPEKLKAQQSRADNSASASKGQPSAIPRPPHGQYGMSMTEEVRSIRAKKSYGDVRMPSYEGTGYKDEISLTKLHAGRKHTVRTPEPVRPAKPPTRLPVPIQPFPYSGQLRAAPDEKYRSSSPKWPAASPPKPVAWPGTSPPKPVAWPGFDSDDEFEPPIPSKSPERWNSTHGHVSDSRPEQIAREESHSMLRIVSKENIRAALGGISRESSAEELAPPMPLPYTQGPTRTMSPGGKLHTYNTHLFPRKEERRGTPVGAWITENRKRYEAGRTYEMEVLDSEGSQKK